MKKKQPKVVRFRKLWKLAGRPTERGVMWGESGRLHASVERQGEGWKWTWRLGGETRSALAPSLELCIELIKASVASYEQELRRAVKEIVRARRAPARGVK